MRTVETSAPAEINDLRGTAAARRPVPSASAVSVSISRLPEIFFFATVLLLCAIRFLQGYDGYIHHPGFDWSSSEWMIDYAAGFVRRGLGGTLLEHLFRATGWGFFPVLAGFTTTLYLGLCAGLVVISWRLRGPALWRFALLFNPILLISACDYGTIGRKDAVFLWGTLLHVLLGEWLLRRTAPAGRRASTLLLTVVVAALALVLALLHEGIFLFLWLPLNLALLRYLLQQLHCSRRAVATVLMLVFAPALLAVAASVVRHGDATTAETICNSWRFAMPVDCSPGGSTPPAVGALTWSLSRSMSLSLMYAWRFPLYLILYALFGAIEVLAIRALLPAARYGHLLALLAVPFVASLPLFLIGVDWGRWLCLLASSSLIVMLSDRLRPAVYDLLPLSLRDASRDAVAPRATRALAAFRRRMEREPAFFCLLLLLLPVPPVPDVAMSLLDPPLIVIRFLLRFFAQ
jgi:hypothetical protein